MLQFGLQAHIENKKIQRQKTEETPFMGNSG